MDARTDTACSRNTTATDPDGPALGSSDPVGEIFAIPLESGASLVYSPLHGVAFAATAGLVAALPRALRGEPVDPDMDAFLWAAGLRAEVAPPASRRRGAPRPTEVTLFLTTACNLRCTYCYASAGDRPATYMTTEAARHGIDFVIENARRSGAPHAGVNYHGGGEPSVHWNLMTESLAYARRRAGDLKVIASAAGNGVLTDRQLDWVIANLDGGMCVSFDGLPEVHDRHRVTVRGAGSSDRVMHSMRRMDDAGYPYAVRLTVTADEIPHLPDSVEFVLSTFSPRRVQVEPAYRLGRYSGAPDAETELFIAAFREANGRAARFGHELMYSAARAGELTDHFCGISEDNFCLSPKGNVSACFEAFTEEDRLADEFFYGVPGEDGGFRFDLDRLNRLRDLTVDRRPFCEGCFAKWNCGGDCHYRSLAVGGRAGDFAGSQRCHITRALLKDQLVARIAAAGGLLWRRDDSAGCPVHGDRDQDGGRS